MSIRNKQFEGKSVTGASRALELFTDRYSFTRLLAERINEDPASEKVLFFQGAGGNGKSLLLRYLQAKMCKRLTVEHWQQLKTQPDDVLAERLAKLGPTGHLPVPTALLDFGVTPPRVEDQPRNPFYGLLGLRRRLAESADGMGGQKWRLRFPLYDFACIWYLHCKGKSPEEIKSLLPVAEAMGVVTTVVDALTGNPAGALGKAVFDLFAKGAGEKSTLYLSRRRLRPENWDAIQRLDVDKELIDQLPVFFAADLNAAIASPQAPKRVVLFFDTHEAFWGEQRDRANYFFQDEWLRVLLVELDLNKGIVVVVSGREVPRWPEVWDEKNTSISDEYLQIEQIGNLAVVDARAYLQNVFSPETTGIDAELCESLIMYASRGVSSGGNEVHPLHLGLCADVVLAALARREQLTAAAFDEVPEFEAKGQVLINRLLRYVTEGMRYAIHGLSACRAFDFEIYRLLGKSLDYTVDRPTFNQLVRFSFVRQVAQRGDSWYQLHDLIRRFDSDPQVEQAHRVLAAHYETAGEIEMIYHFNHFDWLRGVNLWIENFDQALKLSRYEQCQALLELRGDLEIRSSFDLGRISHSEGEYFQTLAKYGEAQREFEEAIAAYNAELATDPNNTATLNNKGTSLQSLADIQASLSAHDLAQQNYNASVTAYDAVLELTPNDLYALNNKGTSLARLADLQASLSDHDLALQNYETSITAYSSALEGTPDNAKALNNKGNSLQSLAGLQANLSDYGLAKENYEAAIVAFNAALELEPEYVYALNNKGNALQSLADLQASLSDHDLALQNYEVSITAFNAALELAPEYVYALNNKGLSLQNLAHLQESLSVNDLAQQNYEASITAFNTALELAPGHMHSLNNKGNSLKNLAHLQASLSVNDLAQQNYEASIITFNIALEFAPDNMHALNNKGLSLQGLADLQVSLSAHDLAQQNYEASITAFNTALELAPDYMYALNNRGISLKNLAGLQVRISAYDLAQQNYEISITAFNDALELAPNNTAVLNNKGLSLQNLADLQASLSVNDLAQQNYEASITAFNGALELAPEYVQIISNKGISLQCLADLQARLSVNDLAQKNYEASITAFNDALELAPEHMYLLNNKGNSLQGLADLQMSLLAHDLAQQNYEASITAFNGALELAPNHMSALNNKGISLARLANLQAILLIHDSAQQNYEASIKSFNKALELAPDDVQIINNKGALLPCLADLQARSGDVSKAMVTLKGAIALFTRSLAIAPNNKDIQSRREKLLAILENLENNE
jgi:tetratricopeptide (TPR) repeat protein